MLVLANCMQIIVACKTAHGAGSRLDFLTIFLSFQRAAAERGHGQGRGRSGPTGAG